MLLDKMLKKHLSEVKTDKYVIELNLPKNYPHINARKTEEGGVRDRFMAAKAELPDEITVIRPFNADAFEKSNVNTVYVATNGDDCNCGCKNSPLATLNEAVNRIKGKHGAKIVLRGGNYTVTQTVNLTSEHSGTQESPLIITAESGETPYLSGGTPIPHDAFCHVTDEKVLKRLNSAAKDHILVCDLKKLGLTNYGTVDKCGTMFVVNGDRYTYARYPNKGDKIERLPMKNEVFNSGENGEAWEIGISDERCLDWEWNDDIWVYGNFFAEWHHLYMKLGKIDKEKKTMKGDISDTNYHAIRYQYDFTHFFANVLEELDVPGEWHLDRTNGLIYVYPLKGEFTPEDDIRIVVPGDGTDIISANKVENVIINGLDIGRTNGIPIKAINCTQFLVQRCRFTSYYKYIAIENGHKNGVIASRMEYFASPAINIEGGDRINLVPCNNFVQNCIAFNSTAAVAISSSAGVGNVVSHNYMHNCGMGDGGNNECINEYNIIEGGDTETSDSGMIYVAGGGCSSCANHFRYNYFFDFAKLDYGIYFDDMSRGMYAYGNIVVGNGVNPGHEDKNGKWWPSGGRSYNHHNGGEHVFYNNISIDAGYFAFGGDPSYYLMPFNQWKGWCSGMVGASLDKRNETYLGRNPTYRDFCAALDRWCEDIKDPNYVPGSGQAEMRLRTAWCNHYENNLIVRADKPYKLDSGEATATGLDTNYITNDDPGFINWEERDYRFTADAQVYKHIPDFVPPPFEKMGPVDDFAE